MTDSGSVRSTRRRTYVPVVGPRLRKLLLVVFGLFSLLAINAAYLGGVTLMEWLRGDTFQGYFYQLMFLGHLVLGLLLVLPLVIYGILHLRVARHRPNRRAVGVGYALFTVALVLLATGLVLTRGIPLIELRDPTGREAAYWLHVITPLAAVWLFVLHRLAGAPIRWRAGGAVGAAALALSALLIVIQAQDPRRWDQAGPASGEQYFQPSLARTASGNFIPARALMQDQYCAECHGDVHEGWSASVHRFASFNNPAYLFSVRQTRQAMLERDGNLQASRFCAGCHDLVPFFSGAFDDPEFDDVGHPTAQAGITCSGCHAITHINSPRGNADYTIEEPLHYPFMYSGNAALQWINRALIKAKPAFHRKTFLKPLHRSPEFCGVCHKVALPEALNGYRWLRGQNHYDSFLLSGVSGHGAQSFYYPEQAETSCNGCHMPARTSADFAARVLDDSGELKIHDHQFPSANTAIPALLDMPESVIQAHRDFLEGSLRLDIVGLKAEGRVDGELYAPLRPDVPTLEPGRSYLLETVLRTLTLGHAFTQGTADSNQIWVEVEVYSGDRLIGRSGAMEPAAGRVDPWSHFVNAWVIDRDGRRIDRRNAEDIFTALYDNQIPPGAADVIHYRLRVPEWVIEPVVVKARLNYRKFDTTFMAYFQGEDFRRNDLPVTVIASDQLSFPVAGGPAVPAQPAPDTPTWQRINDYGIGLLRKRGTGELRQAEEAFRLVEGMGKSLGALNLARVYLREGRLDDARHALERAIAFDPPAYPWTVTWFTALLDRQNGYLDQAIAGLRTVAETRFVDARARGLDFSKDYRVLNTLADTLFQSARAERGEARSERREQLLTEAEDLYRRVLEIDPENAEAHWGLAQIFARAGREQEAVEQRRLHARYKTDDNARDRAIALARRSNPAANHAAEAVVIYDLQRPGAYDLPEDTPRIARH